MKSNICKIESEGRSLESILKESDKVAVYNELDHKQALHLRLLCEEIGGMLPNIISDYSGDFWIEFEDGLCKLNISIALNDLSSAEKNNSAAVGISGKIRSSIESLFVTESNPQKHVMPYGMFNITGDSINALDYTYFWSLNQYRNTVDKEEQAEAWDELEKSVIASVADDIIVGIKGKQADIVVTKKFA